MRRHLAGLALGLTFAAAAGAQSVLGTYTIAASPGTTVTLVLQKNAQGKIVGSFSGNGASYAVEAEPQGNGVAGWLSGGTLRSYFEAERQNATLHMIIADLGADGKPDYVHAHELVLTPATSEASAGSPAPAPTPAAGGNPAASGAVAQSGGTSGLGKTAQDQQIAIFLTSTAWCSFSFSGTSNYSSGTSRGSRAVFRTDGTASETQTGESVNSGSAGTAYGSSTSGRQGRWRIENGLLMLSADGIQWAPQTLKIADNGAGSPIVTAGGKEYMKCR